jgi:hypothetical protein
MKKTFFTGLFTFLFFAPFLSLNVFAVVAPNPFNPTDTGSSEGTMYTGGSSGGTFDPSSRQINSGSAARSSISTACSNISLSGLGGIVDCIIGFLNDALYIIISLTVVVILIGGFNMISSEEKREEGKKTLMYGVIGLAAMVSVWGLVNIVISTLGIGNGTPISPPVLVK